MKLISGELDQKKFGGDTPYRLIIALYEFILFTLFSHSRLTF